jgi:hypothetical protein
MPTAILDGPLGLTGFGRQVCTITGGTRQNANMKIGPDGALWVLLSTEDVAGLTDEIKSFRHVTNVVIDHVCAGKGRWAFSAVGYLLPDSVAFLHITPPKKLGKGAEDGANGEVYVHEFTGIELMAAYNRADVGHRGPRVWRRKVGSAEEIAINFCLKHL